MRFNVLCFATCRKSLKSCLSMKSEVNSLKNSGQEGTDSTNSVKGKKGNSLPVRRFDQFRLNTEAVRQN